MPLSCVFSSMHAFYKMELLGSRLFMDRSGDRLLLFYLQFLNSIDEAKKYSWGSAALGWLYRQHCSEKKCEAKQVCGACLLVQLWAYARFLHKCMVVRHPQQALPPSPLVVSWEGPKNTTEHPTHVLQAYWKSLTSLQPEQSKMKADTSKVKVSSSGEDVAKEKTSSSGEEVVKEKTLVASTSPQKEIEGAQVRIDLSAEEGEDSNGEVPMETEQTEAPKDSGVMEADPQGTEPKQFHEGIPKRAEVSKESFTPEILEGPLKETEEQPKETQMEEGVGHT